MLKCVCLGVLCTVFSAYLQSAPLPTSLMTNVDRFCFFSAEQGRWPAEGNRVLPWIAEGAAPQKILKKASNPIVNKGPGDRFSLILVRYTDGTFAAVLPIPFTPDGWKGDRNYRLSWIRLTENGQLLCEGGELNGSGAAEDGRFLSSRDATPMRAIENVMTEAFQLPFLPDFIPFEEKLYPEPFNYLGWCSWEHYKKNISSEKLIQAAQALEASVLPVRWMLVDDGFQEEEDLRLKSFSPRADRFPQGWEPLIAQRSEKLRWFGLWHCYSGLWNGISPENTFPENLKKGFFTTKNGDIFPGKSPKDAELFYSAFMKSVKDAGFDFVKMDVQCEYLSRIRGVPEAVSRNIWMSKAFEKACQVQKLDVMNCMAMGGVMQFFTRNSASTRCSIDYKLNDADMARSHLWQSYQNAAWLKMSVMPDHDMFHASDQLCGGMMARSKALSGGPVYLSDAPDAIPPELVLPLADSTGKLLRPLRPAVPLPDSFFIDPLNEAQAYRVAAPLPYGCTALCLYNLLSPKSRTTIRTDIRFEDFSANPLNFSRQSIADIRKELAEQFSKEFPDISKELANDSLASFSRTTSDTLAVYDWINKSGFTLKRGENRSVEIPAFSDRLYLAAPIDNGCAILGRSDKYLSPCMVEGYPSHTRISQSSFSLSGNHSERKAKKETRWTLTLRESGPLLVWCEKKPSVKNHKIEPKDLENGFWEFNFEVSAAPLKITLMY